MDNFFIFIKDRDLEKILRNISDFCTLCRIQIGGWKCFEEVVELMGRGDYYSSADILCMLSKRGIKTKEQRELYNIFLNYDLIISQECIKFKDYVNLSTFLRKLSDFLHKNIDFIINYDTSYKLVRDKIPEILRKNDKKDFSTKLIMNNKEFLQKLKEKLVEEVVEFLSSENLEEIVDILEVIDAILKEYNISWKDIFEMKERKKRDRGGFSKRILLKIE